MTPWYRLVVGDPLLDADPFAAITLQFQERHAVDSAARLVTRLESAGGLHCVAVAYLSPEAKELALELEGALVHGPPCPVP